MKSNHLKNILTVWVAVDSERLTMTGLGRASSTQTEPSGRPNRQPRLVLRLRSSRWEEEPLQKAQAMNERRLFNGFGGSSGGTTVNVLCHGCLSRTLKWNGPAGKGGASVGRGFRMNWQCLYAWSCSICRATCRLAAAASLPSPRWASDWVTWLIWILKGNSWPKRETWGGGSKQLLWHTRAGMDDSSALQSLTD